MCLGSRRYLAKALPSTRVIYGPDVSLEGEFHGHHNLQVYLEDDELLRLPCSLRSARVSCRWKDQGWGNRKGQFVLQLKRGGEVVAEVGEIPGIAPHTWAIVNRSLYSDHPFIREVRKFRSPCVKRPS